MENLEQQQVESQIQIGDQTDVEKENEDFVRDVEKLQSDELAELQKFSDEGKTKPVHLKEFVLVEPKLLSTSDKHAFKKFQDFIKNKDVFNLKALDEFMDYFKEYRLTCEKEARKAEAVRGMIKNKKSSDEIQTKINEIDMQKDVPENSRFFMDYLVNRMEGEYLSAIAEQSES